MDDFMVEDESGSDDASGSDDSADGRKRQKAKGKGKVAKGGAKENAKRKFAQGSSRVLDESEEEDLADIDDDDRAPKAGAGASASALPAPRPWHDASRAEGELAEPHLSGKVRVFFHLLSACAKRGERTLLFSQSLYALDVLEEMLREKSERARPRAHTRALVPCPSPASSQPALSRSASRSTLSPTL